MACVESQRLQAYFDSEVDSLTAAAIERHLDGCGDCQEQLDAWERSRASLRRHVLMEHAPAALRARLGQALDHEAHLIPPVAVSVPAAAVSTRQRRRPAPFWLGALAGAGVTALAATAVLWLLPPGRPDTADALEAAHVRSLMPAHLLDVESSERHTVKPWFAGNADVSPVVGDFPQAGYSLLGGRADYLWGQRAAVLVYRHGAHVINVFSWAADTRQLPRQSSRAGYHIVCWHAADLAYCAVSDAGWEELQQLAGLMQGLAARDTPRE